MPAPRPGQGDPLASLARAIVFQQLATRAAAAIHGRFVAAIGGSVTAEAILATSPETLRAAGLSDAKTRSLLDLATKVADGTVPLDDLERLDDDEIVARLTDRPRHRALDRRDVPAVRAPAARRLAGRRPRRPPRLAAHPRAGRACSRRRRSRPRASGSGPTAAPSRSSAGTPSTSPGDEPAPVTRGESAARRGRGQRPTSRRRARSGTSAPPRRARRGTAGSGRRSPPRGGRGASAASVGVAQEQQPDPPQPRPVSRVPVLHEQRRARVALEVPDPARAPSSPWA